MIRGLVFGKFYPPHRGHFYLIDTAARKCDELTVLVCSLKSEEIRGQLRYDWIRQYYVNNSKIKVIHITDEIIQYPHSDDDDRFWHFWTSLILRELPNFDVIFTSEDYGKEIVSKLNEKNPSFKISHSEVDIARKAYTVSGTDIRDNPMGNWKYLPNTVKPYFMKKVILVGPESTGKTVLADKLSAYYEGIYMPEYGREYVENLKKQGKELQLCDFDYIAMGYIELAQKIALENIISHDSKMLILDTDIMTTKIWSEIFFGESSYYVNALEEHYIQKGDLYLLMDIDVPWIDDGERFPEIIRKWHFNRIKKELIDKKLNYKIITGNYEKRFEKAVNIINEFKKQHRIN